MQVKPTPDEAQRRLRIDGALVDDLVAAIDQAYAEAVMVLDGYLYEDLAAVVLAGDERGIVVTADIIAAQLLLADVLVGANDQAAKDSKRATALTILRRHRNRGC
ncbi:hypothetical protein [Xylophilus sp. Leaf220]|uniref:hypothetical protein n=1 Tax=Xylophilus sp. Leaf220 TaxID=1735686 RepID=UPI0006FBEAC9|nr:hypothetical protein [Xylophilus sp. Leaf220]KQM68779.1 hypothetical protein ASE76_13865 [Xylophilus sp. Leaf220]